VAAGDLDARAAATTGDEVGVLVATFNSMIEQIRKSQDALVRQERLAALGQLIATVSHEIRNPLGTIRTSFFVIAQRIRGKGLNVEQALDRVNRSIARCEAIITELLEYSRSRPLEQVPIDLDSWLAALLSEHGVPAKIAVTHHLAAGVRIPLDRERFRRCLVNLIDNACQAMEPSGGDLSVVSRAEDRRAVIRMSDTGCGMAADQLERIFEPLYSTKSFGVGLGLCIVKQIVEQHGGGIGIESRPGQGTTVSLWLPIPEHMEMQNE
jgi:signal transduction histidine kinase